MARTTLALLLALAAASARAQGLTNPPPDARPPAAARDARPPATDASPQEPRAQPRPNPLPRGAILEEISGTVQEVDRNGHRIAVDAGGERVTLSLDRNTMVYTPAGLGTVLDVVPGAQIRAGRNAEFLAYWVQVRGPGGKAEPPSTPGQGTGPGGGSAASATESGAPGTVAPGSPVAPSGTPGPGPTPGP